MTNAERAARTGFDPRVSVFMEGDIQDSMSRLDAPVTSTPHIEQVETDCAVQAQPDFGERTPPFCQPFLPPFCPEAERTRKALTIYDFALQAQSG